MLTTVEFHFVLPTGEPVADTPVEVQLARAAFNDTDEGVAMPRPIIINTDVDGKATLELWPSETMYYVTVLDTQSEAGLSYKFLVPEVAPGTILRLQDLVIETPPPGTTYAETTLIAIQEAKALAISAKTAAEAAAATAVAAVATITDVSADAAAAIAAKDAALSAKDAAELAAFNAATAQAAAAASASAASASATSSSGSQAAAAASAASAATSASDAAASAGTASTQATAASTSAGTATTKAAEAASSASAALASEGAAATSATNAASSATTAAAAATAATSALDTFTDIYLGPKSAAPTLDNDGNALAVGALYFDTTTNKMYAYTGAAWNETGSGGGGGGGAVSSVAGRTGDVVLAKTDVGLANVDNTSDINKPVSTATQAALDGKEAAGAAASAMTAHGAAVDPHPQYTTSAEAAAAAPVQSVAGKSGAVTLAKGDVGLSNVDNTSDANKPISTATQAALDGKETGGAAAAAISAHEAAPDPHAQYATTAEAAAAAPVQSVAGKTGAVSLVKGDVGLGLVDNTADANKPVSTATQAALDAKQAILVSGTSIKTVNGNSLLGSGDVVISGGGGAITLTGAVTGTGTGTVATTLATVPVNKGGTNITSYAIGDLLYADSVGSLAKLNIPGTAGWALIAPGPGSPPQWNKIGLTTHVSGILPTANGGTGFANYTIGDILFAGGPTSLSRLNGVATGNCLISGGVGSPPQWGKVSLSSHISGTLSAVNGGTGMSSYSAGGLLVATSTGSIGQLDTVAAGSVIVSSGAGSVPNWGKVSLTTHVSGTLPVANGGTGATTLTGILKGNGTGAFTAVAAPTGALVGDTDNQTLSNKTLSTGTVLGSTVTGSDNLLTRVMLKDSGWTWYDNAAVNTLNFENASIQRWAPSGSVTLAITNWPATGNLGEMLIQGINLGAATITWPAAVNWVKSDGTTTTSFASNGVTLQTSGTDWVLLWTVNGGTTIYGKVIR